MAKEIKKNESSALASKVLMEPWITEASTMAAELNKYIFKVSSRSTKDQVKRSVEQTFKVKVEAVNVINIHRKKRIRGRITGWKSGFKKAIVTLKEGDRIEFFEGK